MLDSTVQRTIGFIVSYLAQMTVLEHKEQRREKRSKTFNESITKTPCFVMKIYMSGYFMCKSHHHHHACLFQTVVHETVKAKNILNACYEKRKN